MGEEGEDLNPDPRSPDSMNLEGLRHRNRDRGSDPDLFSGLRMEMAVVGGM